MWNIHWDQSKAKAGVARGMGLRGLDHRVVVIVACGAKERTSVDSECGDGVVEDAEDGVLLVAREPTRWVQGAR